MALLVFSFFACKGLHKSLGFRVQGLGFCTGSVSEFLGSRLAELS